MLKDRQDRIVYGALAVLITGLWIVGAVLNYLGERQQTEELRELRSRIEKIEAGSEE